MGLAAINSARAIIFEGQDLIVKARVVNDAGTRISEDGASSTGTVSAASFYVYDLNSSTPDTALNGTTAIDIAGAGGTFTTGAEGYLTTGWDKDGTGYNFAHTVVDGTDVTWLGGHRYRIDYVIAHNGTISPSGASEGDIRFSVEVHVKAGY